MIHVLTGLLQLWAQQFCVFLDRVVQAPWAGTEGVDNMLISCWIWNSLVHLAHLGNHTNYGVSRSWWGGWSSQGKDCTGHCCSHTYKWGPGAFGLAAVWQRWEPALRKQGKDLALCCTESSSMLEGGSRTVLLLCFLFSFCLCVSYWSSFTTILNYHCSSRIN